MNPEQNTHWEVEAKDEAEAIKEAKKAAEAAGHTVVHAGSGHATHGHWHVTLLTKLNPQMEHR